MMRQGLSLFHYYYLLDENIGSQQGEGSVLRSFNSDVMIAPLHLVWSPSSGPYHLSWIVQMLICLNHPQSSSQSGPLSLLSIPGNHLGCLHKLDLPVSLSSKAGKVERRTPWRHTWEKVEGPGTGPAWAVAAACGHTSLQRPPRRCVSAPNWAPCSLPTCWGREISEAQCSNS